MYVCMYVCLYMYYVLQATACIYYLYKYARSIKGLLKQLFVLYIFPSI